MASEMGINVYGITLSPPVKTVLMTLYEKEADDFQLIPVDLMSGEHKRPEFLAMNPFGKVPTFKDDNLVLFESRAIAKYVATKFESQGTPLLGETLQEKALVNVWIEAESQNVNEPLLDLYREYHINKLFMNKGPEEANVNALIERLEVYLDIYEAQLSKTKYLAGDFFSLADVVNMPGIQNLFTYCGSKADVVVKRKHLNAWWEDVSSRPSWKRVQAL